MIPLVLAAMLTGAIADDTQATLRVSAIVAPHCSFTAEPPRAAGGAAAVRATCGTSGLRTLRASASGRAAAVRIAGRQRRAGGEVVFVVSRAEAAADRRDVLVTLDF
jgi:hypothetical protein